MWINECFLEEMSQLKDHLLGLMIVLIIKLILMILLILKLISILKKEIIEWKLKQPKKVTATILYSRIKGRNIIYNIS